MNITSLACIALGFISGILLTIVLVLKDENMHQSIVIRQQKMKGEKEKKYGNTPA